METSSPLQLFLWSLLEALARPSLGQGDELGIWPFGRVSTLSSAPWQVAGGLGPPVGAQAVEGSTCPPAGAQGVTGEGRRGVEWWWCVVCGVMVWW